MTTGIFMHNSKHINPNLDILIKRLDSFFKYGQSEIVCSKISVEFSGKGPEINLIQPHYSM